MKTIIIEPEGWSCTLEECPSGFFTYQKQLCFKTEYRSNASMEVFNEGGECFWGGVKTKAERDKLVVQPVVAGWEDTER